MKCQGLFCFPLRGGGNVAIAERKRFSVAIGYAIFGSDISIREGAMPCRGK